MRCQQPETLKFREDSRGTNIGLKSLTREIDNSSAKRRKLWADLSLLIDKNQYSLNTSRETKEI